MNTSANIAKHIREIHFGGNWTVSNLKDNLKDVSRQEALEKVNSLNTIATLVFHVNYFVKVVNRVLEGGPLEGKDSLSFAHPPITSDKDWNDFVNEVLADGEKLATLVEKLPEEKLWQNMADPKYGIYYRNLHGIVEHMHYHLGQIALIKKLVKHKV